MLKAFFLVTLRRFLGWHSFTGILPLCNTLDSDYLAIEF